MLLPVVLVLAVVVVGTNRKLSRRSKSPSSRRPSTTTLVELRPSTRPLWARPSETSVRLLFLSLSLSLV